MIDKSHPPPPETKHGENPGSIPKDEISLIDLLDIIWRKKFFIFFITFIFTLIAASYSLWVTPIYRTKAGFLPPRGIITPEWLPKGLITETNESIHKQFLTQIKSYKYQQEVFEKEGFFIRFVSDSNKSTTPEKVFLKIHDSINIKKNFKGDETTYVQMEGPQPEVIADFLNSLSKTIIKNIQTETQNLLQTKINNRVRAIATKIALQIEMEQMKQQKKIETEVLNQQKEIETEVLNQQKEIETEVLNQQNRLRYLSDQLAIARKLNIKKNNFDSKNDNTPLWFLYGELFLEEEINFLKSKIKFNDQQLKSRIETEQIKQLKPKTKAPSKKLSALESLPGKTNELIKLESKLKELKSINVLLVKPEVTIISQPSNVPDTTIKPNKKKLILLGMLLGLSFGIIFAFISNAFASPKERIDSSAHS